MAASGTKRRRGSGEFRPAHRFLPCILILLGKTYLDLSRMRPVRIWEKLFSKREYASRANWQLESFA
jgi:hypothetical protein